MLGSRAFVVQLVLDVVVPLLVVRGHIQRRAYRYKLTGDRLRKGGFFSRPDVHEMRTGPVTQNTITFLM